MTIPRMKHLAGTALQSMNAVVIIDSNRCIKWVNDGFTRITGYTLEEVQGKNPGQLLQFENTDVKEIARVRDALSNGEPATARLLSCHKSGREFWLEIAIQPIFDSHGQLSEFIAIETDVTRQVLEQQQLRTIFAAASEGLLLHDLDGNIIDCNPAAERILGETAVVLKGKPIDRFLIRVLDEDGGRIDLAELPTNRVLRDQQPLHDIVLGVFNAKIEFRWLSINAEPIRDPDGNVTSIVSSLADVTNQREQSNKLKLIINGSKTGTWDWNIQTGHVSFNNYWAEMLGYELSDLEQDVDTFIKLLHPNTLPATWKAVQDHLQGKTSEFRNENLLRRKDGTYCWILATGKISQYDSEGNPLRMVGIHVDISKTKNLELKFKELSERYKAAISGTSDGLWDWNLDSGDTWYSSQFWRLLGYENRKPEETSIESVYARIDPEDLILLKNAITESKLSSMPFSQEVRMKTQGDAYRWFRMRGTALCETESRTVRVAGSIQDIESLKTAERSLIASREEAERALREVHALRSALDEHSLLSIADRSGKIIDVNKGFCNISGYQREELIGHDHKILNSGFHSKEFWKDIWRQISSGVAWRGEVCNRRKDGSLYWVDSTIVPYMGVNGKVEKYVSIRFDITAQKAAENSLMAANARAEAANQAKSLFLANMSHEIRTPMTAILGFAELLSNDSHSLDNSESRKEYIDIILRNGNHLLDVINDILDVSKIEAGKMTVDLSTIKPLQLVRDVIKMMTFKASSKGLQLHLRLDSEIPEFIQTDSLKLRQVLINLVGNAIKFTSQGSVTIAVSCSVAQEQLQISVEDTGVGIDPELFSRMFGMFEQANLSTNRKFGGSGLGLHISKRFTEMLGGGISVKSQQGQGSTFRIWLATGPISQSNFINNKTPENRTNGTAYDEVRNATNVPVLQDKPLSNLRILLAEDGPDNQRLISFHLRKAGAHVVIASNGLEALAELTVGRSIHGELISPAPFDLMLCDMQMPELDGYETVKILRSKGSPLKIIALTAHALGAESQKCIANGCDAYASKPIERNQLIDLCSSHSASLQEATSSSMS